MVPDGVRVTLYDQGYSTAAQPLQAMESTAMAVTAACAAGVLVVLFLFSYLFVGRQRETVSVLVSPGHPGGQDPAVAAVRRGGCGRGGCPGGRV